MFITSLRSGQAIAGVKDRGSRDAVLMKARVAGVSLNEEASCPTVFGAYLIADILDFQSLHIHVFVPLLKLVRAIVCASTRRSCGDMVKGKVARKVMCGSTV